MNTKTLTHVEIKNAARGEVSAVFATFNVVDSDGDVTVPGAFAGNSEVPISAYGHASWGTGMPIGKGTIRETATEAILDGRLFMDTAAGRDTFTALKELGELGQWSYGYKTLLGEPGRIDGQDVQFLKQQLVYEVSPVLKAAGVGTRTISAKAAKEQQVEVSYKAAIRPHATEVTARGWDGTAVAAAIPDGASVSDLRSVYAWVDVSGDPEAKTNYRFPHHHGPGGPANVRAALAGIAVLNGARGGTTIPDADRQGVYNHLAAHLRDADREPPQLRSGDGSAKNIDRLPGLLDELAEVVAAVRDVGSSRTRRGKNLSVLTFDVLGWAEEDLVRVLADVRALKMLPRESLAVERARFLAHQFRGANVT